MKPWEDVVSDMKLRASYGVNGNLPTGYYGYHGTYTTGAFYNGKPAPWEDALNFISDTTSSHGFMKFS